MAQIVVQKVVLDMINGSLCFNRHLFEPNPNQNGTTNVIPDDSRLAALTAFKPGQLLGFSVKLLDLPAKAAHVLYDLHTVLSHLVRHDIIRALGRQHNSENFHLMFARKTSDFDDLTMLLLFFCPFRAIHPLVRFYTARFIHQAIILERAVVDFAQFLNLEHDIFGGIPAIHQHVSEQKLLLIHTIFQHVMHMIQLGLAVALRIINAIVDDSELIHSRIDIHTGHYSDPFDDPMCITTPLPPDQVHLEREILIHHRVIKHQVAFRNLCPLTFHIFPYQVGRDLFACQIPVDRIMAEFLSVISKIGQRIIDWTDQQILAIIQTSNGLFVSFHTLQAYSLSSILVKPLAYFA